MAFTSEGELRSAIMKGLTVAVQTTIDEIHKHNEEFIEDVVYNSYNPSWYERTGNFGNSWATRMGSAGSSIEGEFYYKPEMNVSSQEEGQHISVVDGQVVVGVMPDIIYQGAMGCIRRPTNRDAWKTLDHFLNKTMMRSIFEAGLMRSGLPWKRNHGRITVRKWRRLR